MFCRFDHTLFAAAPLCWALAASSAGHFKSSNAPRAGRPCRTSGRSCPFPSARAVSVSLFVSGFHTGRPAQAGDANTSADGGSRDDARSVSVRGSGAGMNLPLSADVSLLIDSNIFIAAEEHGVDGHSYGPQAAELLRLAGRLHYPVMLSHGTRSDLLRAKPGRRERRRRQLDKYNVLDQVPLNMDAARQGEFH